MIDLLVGAPTEIPGLAHWTGNSYHPLESALVLRGGRLEVQGLLYSSISSEHCTAKADLSIAFQ
jgi:hypothetical protein